jgi:hypothetical protein
MDTIAIEQREDFREHLTLGLVSAIGKTLKNLFGPCLPVLGSTVIKYYI